MMEQKITLTRVPPSVNAMYRNVPGRGRVKTQDYKNWLKFSEPELMIQRPRRFVRRVDILIRIPSSQVRRNSDGDNRVKAIMDLLVRQRVIIDDSRDFVRRSAVEWADDIEQTEIIITAVEQEAA